MKRTQLLIPAVMLMISPMLAHAQDMSWLDSVSIGFRSILGIAGTTLIIVAVAVFVWGAVVFIVKSGDEKARTEGKRRMMWGIISIFIIVSVWGFVALIQSVTGTTPTPVTAPRSR